MGFQNIGEVRWGEGRASQEGNLETSLVQTGNLLKPGARTRGQKELLCTGSEGRLTLYLGVGGGKGRGVVKMIFIC